MTPNLSGGRQVFRPPFQYSLLVSATVLPKLLHLYGHLTSLPPLLILLYLPTFLALDVVNAATFWIVAHANIPTSFSRGSIVIQLVGGFRFSIPGIFTCLALLIRVARGLFW